MHNLVDLKILLLLVTMKVLQKIFFSVKFKTVACKEPLVEVLLLIVKQIPTTLFLNIPDMLAQIIVPSILVKKETNFQVQLKDL